jgi:hypothetical protein
VRDVGARDGVLVTLTFAAPANEGVFTITDNRVTANSRVLMEQDGSAVTGRQSDENEFEAFLCRAVPAAGSFKAYVRSLMGLVVGGYNFHYVVR